jgi:type III secretory pathway component EscR
MSQFDMSIVYRGVFTAAILLVIYGLLIEALHLMNLPSDKSLLGGIAMILGLVVATPMILHMIWSKK